MVSRTVSLTRSTGEAGACASISLPALMGFPLCAWVIQVAAADGSPAVCAAMLLIRSTIE
jgi:hypothetical protein